MAKMTALTILMKLNVSMTVQNICSNVIAQDDVFLELGNVMETRIVLMDLMKMTKFAVSFFLNILFYIHFHKSHSRPEN